jgi:hypothetical protein
MTGVIVVLLVIVGAELALREGIHPFATLAGAAAGTLELR